MGGYARVRGKVLRPGVVEADDGTQYKLTNASVRMRAITGERAALWVADDGFVRGISCAGQSLWIVEEVKKKENGNAHWSPDASDQSVEMKVPKI